MLLFWAAAAGSHRSAGAAAAAERAGQEHLIWASSTIWPEESRRWHCTITAVVGARAGGQRHCLLLLHTQASFNTMRYKGRDSASGEGRKLSSIRPGATAIVAP